MLLVVAVKTEKMVNGPKIFGGLKIIVSDLWKESGSQETEKEGISLGLGEKQERFLCQSWLVSATREEQVFGKIIKV